MNLIFQALFTKWHYEGPVAAQCSTLPRHWGCLQTSHLWAGCNAGAIKMTKRWRLKWSMGLLSAFSRGSKSHRGFQNSISKWGEKKIVKQNFVVLIPGGKMSNVVSLLSWLWFLPEVQQNRAILKVKVTGIMMYVCAKQMPKFHAGVFMIHSFGSINKCLSQGSLSISLMETRNTVIYLPS